MADGKVYITFYYGDGKVGPEEIANYPGPSNMGGPPKDSWKKLPNPEEMQKRRASPAADDVAAAGTRSRRWDPTAGV